MRKGRQGLPWKSKSYVQLVISIRGHPETTSLQRGREGGQKYWNLLGKNTKKGEGGGHKIGKMGRRCLWMPPKQDVIYFTKFSKPTMCRVSEAVIKKGIDPLLLGQNHKEDCL